MDNYKKFEDKLEKFIDKFYKISIIKGSILFLILSAVIFLAISSLEFIGWFNYSGRLFLFLFGVVSFLFIFYYFFIVPIFRYFGLFKRLTKRNTEKILHDNLPEIKDYVLNIIELKELESKSEEQKLIYASIIQKIEYTNKIDFQSILTVKKVYPLLKYFSVVFILYFLIFILNPGLISDGSNRIIHFNQEFNKFVGYSILLIDNDLVVEKGGSLNFSILIEGPNVPEYISYYIGKNEYLMSRKDTRNYHATIKSINKSFSFRVGNDQFKSKLYQVSVINPPFLDEFSILVDYPKYTRKENEIFKGISNLKIPIGSKVKWVFACLNTDSLWLKVNNDSCFFIKDKKSFYFDTTIFLSHNYYIKAKNKNLSRELVPKSFVSVIPDLFPEISVAQVFNETNKKLVYFKGQIFDDYGLAKLYFVINDNKNLVPINLNLNSQDFLFSYEFNAAEAEEFTYYFEVFDNDAINGSKSTKSSKYLFKIPDYSQLTEFKKNQDKEIIQKIEKSLLIAQEFKKDIDNLKKRLYSDNLSSFEKQQLIEGLKKKQDILEQILNDFSKQNLNKNMQIDSFNEKNEELLKKQNEIQKLLESVMTDELKALLEEFQKLSLEFNNQDLNKMLDKLEMNYDQLSEQLDKNYELLKKFEIEKNLDIISKELYKISENQNSISADNFSQQLADSLLEEDINKLELLDIQYKEVNDSNKSLDNPMTLEDLQTEFDDLKNDFKNSEKANSTKDKKERYSENGKKSKELGDKIQDIINNNRVDENGENSETLRQILENLIYFSFTQEDINEKFLKSSSRSPVYFENVKSQSNLKENFSLIKDSLLALSKRTPNLGNHISKKVYEIENGLFDVKSYLNENNLSQCRLEQRNILEVSNDLILLLSESLKNMENSGPGNGGSSKKKNKPKQSKPSLAEMRKNQEGMKSQLESMIQKMKEGKGGNGKPSSEQLGKMLAQQEIFQQMMNQLQNSNGVGKDFQKKLNEINQLLEQNRRDLIRSNIDQSTLYRQNQIVTRLLEAEKSEMERELDDKRKSNEAEKYLISSPDIIFEKDYMNINFNDILNSNSLKLNYFYKNKYQEYLKKLN